MFLLNFLNAKLFINIFTYIHINESLTLIRMLIKALIHCKSIALKLQQHMFLQILWDTELWLLGWREVRCKNCILILYCVIYY